MKTVITLGQHFTNEDGLVMVVYAKVVKPDGTTYYKCKEVMNESR